MFRRFGNFCSWASDVAGSVCSIRVHRLGPSARYNLDPPPHRVPPKVRPRVGRPGVSEVPADAQNNHLAREVTAFEGIGRGDRHGFLQSFSSEFATEPNGRPGGEAARVTEI